MTWWGKLVGGFFGFLLGGPLGALLGIFVGNSFDRGLSGSFDPMGSRRSAAEIQETFFRATFVSMGKMAKTDGHVSTAEIQLAQQVMTRMGLSPEMKRVAIDLFNQGKQADYPWQNELAQFASAVGRQLSLKQMFLEIQVSAAFADGDLQAAEHQLLLSMADRLGFNRMRLEQLIAMVRAQQYFYQNHSQQGDHQYGSYQAAASPDALAAAYQALGVKPDDDIKTIKRAYRRLMAQHHPDKLVAKGLPESMIKVATEKTQEIKAAYELISQSRERS